MMERYHAVCCPAPVDPRSLRRFHSEFMRVAADMLRRSPKDQMLVHDYIKRIGDSHLRFLVAMKHPESVSEAYDHLCEIVKARHTTRGSGSKADPRGASDTGDQTTSRAPFTPFDRPDSMTESTRRPRHAEGLAPSFKPKLKPTQLPAHGTGWNHKLRLEARPDHHQQHPTRSHPHLPCSGKGLCAEMGRISLGRHRWGRPQGSS